MIGLIYRSTISVFWYFMRTQETESFWIRMAVSITFRSFLIFLNYQSCLLTLCNIFSFLIQFSGWRVLDEFNYGPNTEVYGSCSTIVMGKMWIFGGSGDYKRQLSFVGTCCLINQGKLPFDLYRGAANTVDELNRAQSALLCFNYDSPTVCHS